MGITGLIPFLKNATSPVHLKDLRGCTVAVDSYCWLHKGVFGCAEKLVRGEETDQYLHYCLKYVEMLLSYNIKPILVFDGQHLPAKALTERRRRETRQQSKQRAAELMRLGRCDEARSHMRRCVDVTHEMALKLIKECRERNVDCIVAPYEADAQMAWLNKVSLAQYIITEDSDLMLFGAKNVIFKLDLTGAGSLVQADKLHLAMGCNEQKYNFEKFRRMCILSGCDYLDSLPGIGLAKACKFILQTEQENMWIALKKIPQYLNMRQLEVSDEYILGFLQAEATFRHMYIYNPRNRQMERLHDLKDYETDERYCANAGTLLDNSDQALQLALGNLNPFTLKQLDDWHPDLVVQMSATAKKQNYKRAKHKSIWQDKFEVHNGKKRAVSCAFYFKKVDFISKSINEDVANQIIEENAKPEEANLYLMYKQRAKEQEEQGLTESHVKRRRSDSHGSDISNYSITTPPQSPLNGTKSHRNPFACSPNAKEDFKNSPFKCQNISLLKALSPHKSKEELESRRTSGGKSFRKSIFATEMVQRVEVRSRFFTANVDKEAQLQSPSTLKHDEEIQMIEMNSQKKQQQRELLYQLSPVKNSFDSGIETQEIVVNVDSTEGSSVKENDIIDLLDDTSNQSSDPTNEVGTCNKIIKLETFKLQSQPRLGLSKPKTTPKITAKRSACKNSAKKSLSSEKSQTRLSMFGFQKRPSLK